MKDKEIKAEELNEEVEETLDDLNELDGTLEEAEELLADDEVECEEASCNRIKKRVLILAGVALVLAAVAALAVIFAPRIKKD